MEIETLKRAISEAERFLHAARRVRMYPVMGDENRKRIVAGAQVAATKRASLDLSKTLADLRQGR